MSRKLPTPTAEGDSHPDKDHYFLGRFRLGESVGYEKLIEHSDPAIPPPHGILSHIPSHANKTQPMMFLPRGFAQMTVMDLRDFNRLAYRFDYIRREFLGEVRCLVFDISPLHPAEAGRFTGRVWVEDRDDNVVRFDGTYVPASTPKGALAEHYFHFDSWRVNVAPGEWVPAEIYVEEEAGNGSPDGSAPRFKAQSRIWDYNTVAANKLDELTSILVDSQSGVSDQTQTRTLPRSRASAVGNARRKTISSHVLKKAACWRRPVRSTTSSTPWSTT